MKKITNPLVNTLAEGSLYVAKQMMADAGALLPRHTASLESVVFVQEGEIILDLGGEAIALHSGQAISIPQDVVHQIRVISAFKGIHFMPREISFKFLN